MKLFTTLFIVLCLSGCFFGEPMDEASVPTGVRMPVGAGELYEAKASKLARLIELDLQAAKISIDTNNVSKVLIAPGDSPAKCGVTLAHTYKYLSKQKFVRTVILLSRPLYSKQAGAFLYGGNSWKTPLGEVLVNQLAVRNLLRTPPFKINDEIHARETSLEVQAIYLKHLLPKTLIVPVLFNPSSEKDITKVAKALAKVTRGDGNYLVVVSNLSQGCENEFATREADRLMISSLSTLSPFVIDRARRRIKKKSARSFIGALSAPYSVICAMKVARILGMDRAKFLSYSLDADEAYGYRHVGYLSGIFEDSGKRFLPLVERNGVIHQPPQIKIVGLSDKAKAELVTIARDAVGSAVVRARYDTPELINRSLMNPRPAFVTLYVKNKEHGSKGVLYTSKSLAETVNQAAYSATCEDPRFFSTPLSVTEARDVRVVISLVSNIKALGNWRKLDPKKQGVVIEHDNRYAVILPQTARLNKWDAEKTMRAACLKAGFAEDVYKRGYILTYTFDVDDIE